MWIILSLLAIPIIYYRWKLFMYIYIYIYLPIYRYLTPKDLFINSIKNIDGRIIYTSIYGDITFIVAKRNKNKLLRKLKHNPNELVSKIDFLHTKPGHTEFKYHVTDEDLKPEIQKELT